MKIAYLQCETGLSGDMFLAALVDAGAPLREIQRLVDEVCPEPVELTTEHVLRAGFAALGSMPRSRKPRCAGPGRKYGRSYVQAEYEDLYATARQSGVPAKVILAEAMAKAAQLRADSD